MRWPWAEINLKPGGTGAPKNSLQRHRETLASTHDLDPSERVTVVVGGMFLVPSFSSVGWLGQQISIGEEHGIRGCENMMI